MARLVKYFKCKNCGNGLVFRSSNGTIECSKCKGQIVYDEKIEREWLNELDENGDRIRMEFLGATELECRKNAADFWECDIKDIIHYYIIQRAGILKKFIIWAERPIKYIQDPDAVRIVMWEYEGKPSAWCDINIKKKTILYPYVLGNTPVAFNDILDLTYEYETTLVLKLDPQGDVTFLFSPLLKENIATLVDAVYDYIPKKNHGMFTEEFFLKSEFNPVGVLYHENAYLQISSDNFNYKGYLFVWKNENDLCFCNSGTRIGYRFPISNIKYYRLVGQKLVTTEISGGGGGGVSIKGAVVGGLIAGDVGAIIGSRQEVKEVKGTSTIHDERQVLLYDKELKQVVQFNSEVYEIFMKLLPEKEYEVVIQSDTGHKAAESSNIDSLNALEKLADLYEKHILTKEEFEAKKKEILSKI